MPSTSSPSLIPPRISASPATSSSPRASSDALAPPNPPFSAGLRPPSLQSLPGLSPSSQLSPGSAFSPRASLSLNYIPAKFSRPHSPGIHIHQRKPPPPIGGPRGGGRAAFAEGESRMPVEGDGDEDEDGWVQTRGKTKPRLRWNRFKWVMFFTNILLTAYSLTALITLLLTWFNVFPSSDVILTANYPELVLSTVAASLCLLTALIGWSGILLNNRAFLGVYCLLLWVSFGLLVAPGYVTYKRKTFNLEGKINSQWSKQIGVEGRLKVQNQLHCCGYYSPFVEATISQTCYARSTLPGCKAHFLHFERYALQTWYTIAFSLVPLHLIAIVVSLLCANHVTYRFGKGMMPRAYRLSVGSMAVIMDSYASQIADQYALGPGASGSDLRVGSTIGLARTRSKADSVYYDTPEIQTPNGEWSKGAPEYYYGAGDEGKRS